ncbi:MAG: histidine kinase, partial [Hymenobacter sp.]
MPPTPSSLLRRLPDRPVALLLQGLLWVLLTGFYYALYNRPNFHFVHAWALVLSEVSYGIVLFNSLVYFLIPRWLLRGRYRLALAGGVGLCVLYRLWDFGSMLLMVRFLPANSSLVQHMQYNNSPAALKANFTTFEGLVSLLYGPLTTAMFPVIISFLAYALIVDRRRLALESTQFKLELSYVKAQLNPQFLFHTLSQLQGLTRVHDPRAGDVVLHLADLLRYTLYE